jgi:NitT/TauT family transport system substrate-binding protein
MSQVRIRDFLTQMVKAGLYMPGEIDVSRVATMQFVNKKVGMDIKAQLEKK